MTVRGDLGTNTCPFELVEEILEERIASGENPTAEQLLDLCISCDVRRPDIVFPLVLGIHFLPKFRFENDHDMKITTDLLESLHGPLNQKVTRNHLEQKGQ